MATNKKKKCKTKRKLDTYAMGSGNTGVVKGYIPDPNEALLENQQNLAQAKYEAASNPWLMGMDMVGQTAMQYGMSEAGGLGGVADQTKGAFKTMFGKKAMGTGPEGTEQVPIEAEGGEVIEGPGGKTAEIKGPKHAQGGVPMEVPEGTKVFSQQLKIDGKSMADRKKARESKMKKLQKKVDNDKSDLLSKETFKRTKVQTELEEQQDLELQGFAAQLDEVYDFAMGTGKYGVQKMNIGTGPNGAVPNPFGGMLGNVLLGAQNTVQPEVAKKEGFQLPDLTGGDLLGMAGGIYGGIAPMLNTKNNWADTDPNENMYAGFGEDALKTNQEAGQMLDAQQDRGLKELNVDSAGAINRARSGARGVNQARAMELGVFSKTNDAKSALFDNFSKMMMANLDKKAQLENLQDEAVMGGAATADIANRADKDNYYSNLGADKVNMAQMIQNMGKNLNVSQGNKDFLELLPDMSMYDVGYERVGGKLKQKVD